MTGNDQMQELCNFMGMLFLTMARPSDLAKAEFDHFDSDKLIWQKHNTEGIKLSRSLYECQWAPKSPRMWACNFPYLTGEGAR
ncbi:hypothetical protein [Mesorhizobium australafricanum]|uniref:Integrase n=1 Tax=Mesorhizobium australafricanum TaxID=3072311 RepID=A0ABU4X422_9HYPH|nr:hypothetical protein [Mesorhizobium sp. VK3E]MDX8443072.1 hypothetical protein [Mesorhizobium sp. VK3E]